LSTQEYFGFKFVKDLLYNEHIWTKVETDGNVRVGFDDIIAKGSVKIYAIKLLPIGKSILQKKKMGIIESTKYTGPIVAPISGEIISVNDSVRRFGANGFKNDPYGQGWLYVIKPTNLSAEQNNLLQGDAAANWFKKEAELAKDNIAAGEQASL